MSTATTQTVITKTPGVCGGKARIDGHRVRVQDIVTDYEWNGLSPDEICQQYPTITLAHVHAALSYYYEHRDEIQADIASERLAVETFQQSHPDAVR